MKTALSTFLSIYALCLTPTLGFAIEKHFYMLGGGGEPKGEKTIFDNDLKNIGSFSNNSDWKTTVSFNGGHGRTEDILASRFSKAINAGPFLEKSYNQMINEMITKIESGLLKDGDQLMLVINTHGARNTSKEKTHAIATAKSTANDLTNLSGAETVNLDNLETLANLAAAKGVKLAIMDMSCFSGNLLNIKNDKVCMISATGSKQFGYAGTFDLGLFSMTNTFSGKFFDLMKPGKNLEDIFLAAREKAWTADYPMISTKNGRLIDDLLYKMITPYLNYNDGQFNSFSNQYPSRSETFENTVCSQSKNYDQLKSLLVQYEQVDAVTDQLAKQNFKSLRESLEEYRQYQLNYEVSLRGQFQTEKEITSLLEKKYPDQKKIWKDIAPLDFLDNQDDSQLSVYKKLLSESKSEQSRKMWQSSIDSIILKKEMSESIKASLSDESRNKLKEYEKAFSKSDVTKKLAVNVASQAKKVYESLYRKEMSNSSPNPCRDFIL